MKTPLWFCGNNNFSMGRLLLLIVYCHLPAYCFAQFPDTAFIRTFGGKNIDVGRDVQYCTDGGFILVGTTSSFGSGNSDIYLIKVDSNGIYQWSKTIGGTGVDWGFSVKQTFDNGFVVAGYTNSIGYGGYDMYLVKTDSMGKVLWEKTYGGTDWDLGYCVQQLPDSGFILCGETYSFGNGNTNAFFVRTRKNGDTLWTRTAGGDSTDIAYSITVYNDSTYFFTGETNSFGQDASDVYWGAINKQGDIYLTKTIGNNYIEKGYWIEKISNGDLLVFGETDSTSPPATVGKNELLLKISTDGTLQWSQIGGGTGEDIGRAIREKSNGELITCGNSNSYGAGGFALFLTMRDSYGGWQSSPSFGGAGDETGYSLVITPKKHVAFIGSTTTYGQGQEDIYFIFLKNDSIVQDYTLDIVSFNDTFLFPIGAVEYNGNQQVIIYPNPFLESSKLRIQSSGLRVEELEIEIFDVFGNEMYTTITPAADGFIICRDNLPNGIYFFQVITRYIPHITNKVVATGKFIITN